MTYQAHPAASLFPLMEGDEFQGLVDDIRTRGLKHPIVTFGGEILDGRNRQRACVEAGVEPRYVEAELNGDGPVEYVMGENLHRRNLTPSQKAAIAVNAMPLFAAEAKERQQEAGRLYGAAHPKKQEVEPKSAQASAGRTREVIADKFGVGHSQVGAAIALKKRAPEIFKKVESGDLTIGSALTKAGLNKSGATAATVRPRADRHKAVMAAAEKVAYFGGKWERSMTDALTPPQAKKQLVVLHKAADMLAAVIEAVEYRADTPHTFLGR